MRRTEEPVKDLLDSTIESVGQVIPVPTEIRTPTEHKLSVVESEIGVLVGITGDIYGRIVIVGNDRALSKLGESMFGMPLAGEMLHSFVGEMANMIAGNASTIVSRKGWNIDITPPTVMAGQLQLYGFEEGVSVVLDIAGVGELKIILLLQKNRGV